MTVGEAVIAVFCSALACAAAAAPRYVATPLGTLGGSASEGAAINASGQITGRAQRADGSWHAFVQANGTMQDIEAPGGSASAGSAINGSGFVVGCTKRPDDTQWAFLYDGAGMQILFQTLVPTSPADANATSLGCPVAIDDAGRIGGSRYWSFEYSTPPSYLYFEGVFDDAPQTLSALANGRAAGTHFFHVNAPQAWLMENGNTTALVDFNRESYADAVNDNGEVTGAWHQDPHNVGPLHAYLYSAGHITDLGSLGDDSYGLGLNNLGEVVGFSGASAFLYTSGRMYDLNVIVRSGLDGAWLTRAVGINDMGTIVANACDPAYPPAFPCRAFRLDRLPDDDPAATVPTLSGGRLGLLALLLATLGFAARRRR